MATQENTTSVRLDKRVAAKLAELKRAHGVSRNRLVNEILAEKLGITLGLNLDNIGGQQ